MIDDDNAPTETAMKVFYMIQGIFVLVFVAWLFWTLWGML